jgi:hypothetical protein
MGARLVRRQGLLVKIETQEGSDVTPAGVDSVRMAGPGSLELGAEFQNLRDEAISQLLDKLSPLAPAGLTGTLSYDVHLRGYGTAYSAANKPELDAVLRSAGLSATNTGTTTWVYETASTALETVSTYFELDGKRWKLLGARSNVSFTLPAGGPGVAHVVTRGLLTKGADGTAYPTTGTFQTAIPPVGKGLTLSHNSVTTLVARQIDLDLGNSLLARPSVSAADALAGIAIGDRAPTWRVQAEDPLVATADFETLWSAATIAALAVVFGGTQYNRTKFDLAEAVVSDPPKYSNANGLSLVEFGGRASGGGASRFKITYD